MRKRILLVDPYFEEGLKGFPLGLAYVAAALRDDYDLSCLDITARAYIRTQELLRDGYGKDSIDGKGIAERILTGHVADFRPDLVGITSTSPTHLPALEVARIIKGFGNIPIIKGGPHETSCSARYDDGRVYTGSTLKVHPEIDYSVFGEGELTIVELAERIFRGLTADGVKGTAYRESGSMMVNPLRPFIRNLDSLKKPARDMFYLDDALAEYYSARMFGGKKSTSFMTSRGCTFYCSFCSSGSNWLRTLRQRSVGDAVAELEDLYAKGFRGFMFEDDMFISDRLWFLEFARKIKEKGLDIEYSAQTRADRIDEKIAGALSESGCRLIYFGVESGVEDILKRCNKGVTVETMRKAFSVLRQYNITTMASIQFGLPGEDLRDYSTIRETIRVLNEELVPDKVAVSYTCLYPGSPLSIQLGITPLAYEDDLRSKADRDTFMKTAHATSSKHPAELTDEKRMIIEGILKQELRIERLDVSEFYNT